MMVIKEDGPHYPTILVCLVYYCRCVINITAVMTNCQAKQSGSHESQPLSISDY